MVRSLEERATSGAYESAASVAAVWKTLVTTHPIGPEHPAVRDLVATALTAAEEARSATLGVTALQHPALPAEGLTDLATAFAETSAAVLGAIVTAIC